MSKKYRIRKTSENQIDEPQKPNFEKVISEKVISLQNKKSQKTFSTKTSFKKTPYEPFSFAVSRQQSVLRDRYGNVELEFKLAHILYRKLKLSFRIDDNRPEVEVTSGQKSVLGVESPHCYLDRDAGSGLTPAPTCRVGVNDQKGKTVISFTFNLFFHCLCSFIAGYFSNRIHTKRRSCAWQHLRQRNNTSEQIKEE